MSNIIEVHQLYKRFKGITAVNNLSFAVPQGEVYGFLGQNGAGKSTTIRMLLTLIAPTAGSIQVFQKSLHTHRNEILKNVGAIIEKPDMYQYLTALQNLKIMARLSGYNATGNELMQQLQMVGLAQRAHSKVKTFSQGMKQRLGLACALIHKPKLIVLDEPTNGLDPQGIADIRNLILHLSREQKKTVLISSHLLSEVEQIADSMLIIDKGQKVAEGKVAQLLNPADTVVELLTTNNEVALQKLGVTAWGNNMQLKDGKILLHMHKKAVPQLNSELVAMGIEVEGLRAKHSLEDYFLSLTTVTENVATDTN